MNLFATKSDKGYDLLDDEDTGEWNIMLLRGPWQTHFSKVIADKKIKALRLSYSAGWREASLDFLKDVPSLEALDICSPEVKDVSLAMSFSGLKRLSISAPFNGILDMSAFPELENFSVEWRRGIRNLDTCRSLKTLLITAYPHSDLVPLAGLHQLNWLSLYSRQLKALTGLSALEALTNLSLSYCPELIDTAAIGKHHTMQGLEFDHCKRLAQLPEQLDLPALTEMMINNCPALQSLRPLGSLAKLAKLYFIEKTSVQDGQIAFLAELPALKEVWYQDRRHYDIKRDALKLALLAKFA